MFPTISLKTCQFKKKERKETKTFLSCKTYKQFMNVECRLKVTFYLGLATGVVLREETRQVLVVQDRNRRVCFSGMQSVVFSPF